MKYIKIIVSFLFLSFSLYSQWNTNTGINTPICLATKSQNNLHSVTDSKGGAILAWDDNRNSLTTLVDVYAQRIKSDGVNKWQADGVVICNNVGVQQASSITDAGNGSAIITWEDNRNGNYDIYAQKVDSAGNVLWATNGVAVCAKTTNQKSPKIISDNAGGAIVVWEDSVLNYWDIYAQRINANGSLAWATSGVIICSSANTQLNPKLDVDNLGGAVITWQDKRNAVDYDIYAQRINSLGAVQWTSNGVAVCTGINTQNNAKIEPDGASGAYIAWADKRNGTDNNVYAQHLNATGAEQWASGGLVVCNAINNQSAIDIKYLGTAGLLITWKDDRVSPLYTGIYTQLISSSGTVQLTINGLKLSGTVKSINPNTVLDNTGGAIIAWQDSTSVGWDIMSQKISSNGLMQWPVNGVAVSNATNDQINVAHVTDNNGGAIYTWEDKRNGTDYNIYANRLNASGTTVVGINELTNSKNESAIVFPNPITKNSLIKLPSSLTNKNCTITIYSLNGELQVNTTLKANQTFNLNAENFSNGIYFYIINTTDNQQFKGNFISAN